MKTINWGTKIAILYSSFVVLIVFLVYKSINQKVDLVSKDYYEQELNYQSVIDGKDNANSLTQAINCEVLKSAVKIELPTELKNKTTTGTIYFYRPSDDAKDLKVKFQPSADGFQTIDKSALQSGVYKMQLDFTCDGKKYFLEKVITV